MSVDLTENQLRLVIDTIPVMAWIVLPDGRLEFLNRRWLEYSGLSLDEALASPTAGIHPDDIAAIFNTWPQHLASGEPYEAEMRLRRADGEYRWFLVRTVAQFDDRGGILRWYGTSTDIEDRKRAEDALRESQQRLDLVLETMPVGVLVTDQAGDAVLANPASKHIWGGLIVSGPERWARSKGRWHDSGKELAPTEWASLLALTQGKATLDQLIDIEAFDGRQKTIHNSSVPIRDAKGVIVGTIIVNEDVTDRVRAEEALRESTDRMQYLSRRLLEIQEEDRRQLSRELHDEFGQLLTSIDLHLHVARMSDEQAARASLEKSIALLKQASEQVRTLALALRPVMLDTEGLDRTLRWLAEQHRPHGIAIDVAGRLDHVPPDVAIACFRVVQQALTNVVQHANARHAWIVLHQDEERLEVEIRDDGTGFDVARMVGNAAKRGHLGLLGMYERVELLRGDLRIDSEPGRGTRLRASFPLRRQ